VDHLTAHTALVDTCLKLRPEQETPTPNPSPQGGGEPTAVAAHPRTKLADSTALASAEANRARGSPPVARLPPHPPSLRGANGSAQSAARWRAPRRSNPDCLCRDSLDCFAALAMTPVASFNSTIPHSICGHTLAISRRLAPELFRHLTALFLTEGAGKAGRWPRPWPACGKNAGGRYHRSGRTPGPPCAMF